MPAPPLDALGDGCSLRFDCSSLEYSGLLNPKLFAFDLESVYVHSMTSRTHQRKSWRGSFLLLLALVAAVGPAWASAYLCPMARAEAATSACCAHHPSVDRTQASFAEACHCPKLSWQADAIDYRSAQVSVEAPAVATVPVVLISVFATPVERTTYSFARPPARSGPALWVRNQAILC